MNWDNWGIYKLGQWSDNDQSTWKWQIDHIIPQSELLYTDMFKYGYWWFKKMSDDNFKKSWSLENLRPYSAKQNAIDGGSKIRHENINSTILRKES